MGQTAQQRRLVARRVAQQRLQRGVGQARTRTQQQAAAQGQFAQQGGFAQARAAANPGPLTGVQGRQPAQFGGPSGKGRRQVAAHGLRRGTQRQVQLAGLAFQHAAEWVIGGAEQPVDARQIFGFERWSAGHPVGGLGLGSGSGKAGRGGVLLSLMQQRRAPLAGQLLAGVQQPFSEFLAGFVAAQTVGEGSGVERPGDPELPGPQGGAEFGGVTPGGGPHPAVVGGGAAESAQVRQRHRQIVHRVGGSRPEQFGQEAPGLGAFQREVGQQQQGLFAAKLLALKPQPPQRVEPHASV